MALLVGDIGGTNARFALAGDDFRPEAVAAEPGDAHASFEAALGAYLESTGLRPGRAAFAVAGPVSGTRSARVTNRPGWIVDADEIERRFGFSRAVVVNDFAAQAASLPHLLCEEIEPIGGLAPKDGAPKVALGPGTGLGVAGLVPAAGGWLPVAGEGGHVELAALEPQEWSAFETLRRRHGRVEAETVLSGPGLAKLHGALHGEADLAAADIVAAAERGEAQARATASLFLKILARFSGDMALAFKAEGGVYLCGGVAAHMLPLIDAASFRAAFEAKAPHDGLMRRIATLVVTSPVAGLVGCAAEARRLADAV